MPPEAVDNRGRLLLFNVQLDHAGVYVCSTTSVSDVPLAQKAAYLTVQPSKFFLLWICFQLEKKIFLFFSPLQTLQAYDYEIMINHLPQNDQGGLHNNNFLFS